MAQRTIPLKHGLKIGEELAMDAVVRDATAGDIIDAGLESERLFPLGDDVIVQQSPSLVGINLLRRQIERLGTYDGVVTVDMLRKLHPDDWEALQAAADGRPRTEELARRGRDDPPGTGD